MARDVGLIFEDIEASILGIMQSIDARDYAAYRDTWIVRHGVQRCIEIISEASRHLPADLVERYPTVDCAKFEVSAISFATPTSKYRTN